MVDNTKMRIAFVGIKREYQKLDVGYKNSFDNYHIELPWYYAKFGGNDVTTTTVDTEGEEIIEFPETGGILRRINEKDFIISNIKFDVVVHWRKWFEELRKDNAINVLNCQDHSFSYEWKDVVKNAFLTKKLYGILCFPYWHENNIKQELSSNLSNKEVRTISGLTLGVDTEIYKPSVQKDPRMMLWASDPGRGIDGVLKLTNELWKRDRRYKLIVTYPDYVKQRVSISHPAIKVMHGLRNGKELWNLFNTAGIIPYTSTFMEPSSRCHRQGQAAGCMVLYPPNMGTPSDLIQDGKTGFVKDISHWANLIEESIENGVQEIIGRAAREFAITENWEVQAKRFTQYFGRLK